MRSAAAILFLAIFIASTQALYGSDGYQVSATLANSEDETAYNLAKEVDFAATTNSPLGPHLNALGLRRPGSGSDSSTTARSDGRGLRSLSSTTATGSVDGRGLRNGNQRPSAAITDLSYNVSADSFSVDLSQNTFPIQVGNGAAGQTLKSNFVVSAPAGTYVLTFTVRYIGDNVGLEEGASQFTVAELQQEWTVDQDYVYLPMPLLTGPKPKPRPIVRPRPVGSGIAPLAGVN